MARNIELKARLAALEPARRIAARLATSGPQHQRQIDTYFHVTHGRLKLREIDDLPTATLIWYLRQNEPGSKPSDYRLTPVAHPRELKESLRLALGERGTVDKQREIYWFENVRIHLDQVRGLGTFLEFEAVLSEGESDVPGEQHVRWLGEQFGIADDDRIALSYSDLLRQA